MRSVQVFPRMDVGRVTALLDSVGERSGSEWFGVADRRLEIQLMHYETAQALIAALGEEGSFSAVELGALQQLEDELSGVWVDVRMSGRGDYQANLRDLVVRLMAEGGCAVDDYSDHVWSSEQIQVGGPAGRIFRA